MLLEAAKDIVKEGGVDGLTISKLASRIGASVGGVYRHFDSKGAILVALEVWAIQSFGSLLEGDLDATRAALPGGREGALLLPLVGFTAYARHRERDPERHQLLDAFMADARQILSDEEARTVESVLTPVVASLASLLAAAVRAGALSDGDAVQRTYVAWALFHGADHFQKRDRLVPELLHARTVRLAGLRALFLGWGADPAALDAALARLTSLEPSLLARPLPEEPVPSSDG